MINENDLVLVWRDEERNYLLKAGKGQLHTDMGFFNNCDIVGKEYGDNIATNLGHKFYLLQPTLDDMIMKIKRMTQILYPKDIGLILTRTNLFPGARVIECGVGSGALTTALANFVRPNGKVYCYERSEQFAKNAQKNLEKYGLETWAQIEIIEIKDEFPQNEVDFVMIDIGSQWDLVGAAHKALKGGCRVSAICPTFDQLTRTVFTMEETGFVNIETVELLMRRILVRRGKTRPEQRMPSHTGYLVFGSKILEKPKPAIEPAPETDQPENDIQTTE